MMAASTRADATRTRVLDAALAVYEAHGHAGFNVHAIVARSSVSMGSLYHHFGSMDGLAAALYARSMATLLDRVGASLARARTLRGGVTAIVEAYLTFARRERAAMSFIHTSAYASFLPAHADLIKAAKAPRLAPIHAFFSRRAEAGEVVPLPLPLLEVVVIGPVAELTRRWLADHSELDLDQAARQLPGCIHRAIAKDESAT
jgi:AcrR family transcriptional regulator